MRQSKQLGSTSGAGSAGHAGQGLRGVPGMLSSPVIIQSIGLPQNAFSFSKTSSVGNLWPFSSFDNAACVIPRILPNSA